MCALERAFKNRYLKIFPCYVIFLMRMVNVTFENYVLLKPEIEFYPVEEYFKLIITVGLKSMCIKYENETPLG